MFNWTQILRLTGQSAFTRRGVAFGGLLLVLLLIGLAGRVPRGHTPRLAAASPETVAAVKADTANPAVQARLAENYGKLPLSFEKNQGQATSEPQFISHGNGYNLLLTPTEAVLALKSLQHGQPPRPLATPTLTPQPQASVSTKGAAINADVALVRMKLVGANRNPTMTGLDELPGKVNYLHGKNQKNWRTDIPTYAKVKYKKAYPGIDLVYYGNQRLLEYDFIVSPGANPNVIRLSFDGAKGVSVEDKTGDLLLATPGGQLRLHKPMFYQDIGGQRRNIDGKFFLPKAVKHASFRVGFQLSDYDKTQSLVIDPVLDYSTYLGGDRSSQYYGQSIAVDSDGNTYVTGYTGLPAYDAFIFKINASGTSIIYLTYIGGTGNDYSYGITVDGSGNAYITGQTSSPDFPAVNAMQSHIAGQDDAFILKLNTNGNTIGYSTYLGGSGIDIGRSIAVDSVGNAYVTGETGSTDFRTVNALYPNNAAVIDAFVIKINPVGIPMYSTYLGGSNYDYGRSIATDNAGNAYVTGDTGSVNFPLINAANSQIGLHDAFITKISTSGNALIYSTFWGGSDNRVVPGVKLMIIGYF